MNSAADTLKRTFEESGSFCDTHWSAFLDALEKGEIRVVEQQADGSWKVNSWVKAAILSGFKKGGLSAWPWPASSSASAFGSGAGSASPREKTIEGDSGSPQSSHSSNSPHRFNGSGGSGFFDRPAFPPRHFEIEDGVRMVPGGSSVRRGAFVASGVVIMPPSYINVGAWVDEGTMVDSHVLVGSCAHIGKRVHLSAGVQIGGVLEPPQASPVIIEDEAFIGGMCGIFEGIIIRRRAVLAPGVIITKGTKLFDLVNGRELSGEVPENAVVVSGARPAHGEFASQRGISLSVPCIVKYRDEKTDSSVVLESALRG
jgi:2,3,4,5-tetrahydropyridine-2-carboxylate N-succinyltransferase